MSDKKSSCNSLKARIKTPSGKNQYLSRFVNDRRFRVLTTTALGGGWNLVYALFHLAAAAFLRSYWFLTMGVYYLTVCGMRASALRLTGREQDKNFVHRAIRRTGFLMLCLAVIFSGVVCLTISEKRNSVYHIYIAIAMAAYTFYCAVNAIINMAKLKKTRTVQLSLLRNISFACALGAMFGLERMMLGTFGNASTSFTLTMEAASGAGFFLLLVLLSINLLNMSAVYAKNLD